MSLVEDAGRLIQVGVVIVLWVITDHSFNINGSISIDVDSANLGGVDLQIIALFE